MGIEAMKVDILLCPIEDYRNDTVENILGGVRPTATYIGARRLKDMPKCAICKNSNVILHRVYETLTVK